MNRPELYKISKQQQQYEAFKIIQYFAKYVLGKDLSLIDIGTGDGYVLTEIISAKFDLRYALGVDKSINMVEFGRANFESEKIKFSQLDISDDLSENPTNYECLANKFDIVTALYCFHWVQDLRVAFKNVAILLKPNGWFCCTMIKDSRIIDAYIKLSITEKYGKYMYDVKNYIPPTREHSDTEPIRQMLLSLGFHVEMITIELKEFDYVNRENYFNFVQSINPFMTRMPFNMRADFIDEIVNVDLGQQTEAEIKWKTDYSLMTIIAQLK